MKAKCKHPNAEVDTQVVSEGYFKVFKCPDCKIKEYLDYYHDGSKYEHEGFQTINLE